MYACGILLFSSSFIITQHPLFVNAFLKTFFAQNDLENESSFFLSFSPVFSRFLICEIQKFFEKYFSKPAQNGIFVFILPKIRPRQLFLFTTAAKGKARRKSPRLARIISRLLSLLQTNRSTSPRCNDPGIPRPSLP